MKKKQPKYFNYSGYEIPVSFILRLKYKKGLQAFDIDRIIFWGVQYCNYKKAHGVKVSLVQAIQSGLSNGWIWKLISSEFESKSYIQGWIDAEIYGKRPEPKPKRTGEFKEFKNDRQKLPDSIGDILKGLKL